MQHNSPNGYDDAGKNELWRTKSKGRGNGVGQSKPDFCIFISKKGQLHGKYKGKKWNLN